MNQRLRHILMGRASSSTATRLFGKPLPIGCRVHP